MRDEQQRNPGTISGTPALIDSLLVRDPDKALRFSGGSSFSIPDSPSISLPVVVGGAAIEFSIKPTAYPGAEANLVSKSGSYAVNMMPDGKLKFYTTGLSFSSLQAVPLNVKTHVVCVYNGDYSGVSTFGKTSVGATTVGLEPDYIAGAPSGFQNLHVARAQLFEKGQLDAMVADLVRFSDHPYPQWIAAVLYDDNAGEPGELVFQSAPLYIDAAYAVRSQVVIPASGVLYPGFYWRGMVGGNVFAGGSEHPVTLLGVDNTGGTRRTKNAVVTNGGDFSLGNAPSSFGAAGVSDAKDIAVYCDYTPLARTGAEGKMLIYLNGALDNSTAYTAGITDSANAVTGPTFDVGLDDLAFYNDKLTAAQVARHYAAR